MSDLLTSREFVLDITQPDRSLSSSLVALEQPHELASVNLELEGGKRGRVQAAAFVAAGSAPEAKARAKAKNES